MDVIDYIEKKKYIQKAVLDFIDCNENNEESYENLSFFIEEQYDQENRCELKIILRLILEIASNNYRNSAFFNKIDQIIIALKNQIMHLFSNYEIFYIFKGNKRILLLLFKEKILNFEPSIFYTIMNGKYQKANYPSYFFPEIKTFYEEKLKNENDKKKSILFYKNCQLINKDYDLFELNRKNGLNEEQICELIRNDCLEEFISFIQNNQIRMTTTIKPSIFETNNFLHDKECTLIEYATFYGSINIFTYLSKNKVELTESLWLFAAHNRNTNLITLLIDLNAKRRKETYQKCLAESIKCHNFIITDFIKYNLMNDQQKEINNDVHQCLKYYNFCFLPNEFLNANDIFYDCCKYDYLNLVRYLYQIMDLNINDKQI
ncbi:hypothetical protein M9Y10_011035 [Tritrichomonas musculus]|uniref:DUF3447 domain-containing protein n=1 Tax=Tritrichomonas musculus TaxID=1915356 RepID=A0ABR2IME0_9EUKA